MENISWKAPEFEQPDRHPNWFVSLWIFAVALVIVAIILKSYLLAVFIILAGGIINIYALKVPETFDFELTREHIKIGNKTYDLQSFKSFWIFEHENGNVLFLDAKKGLRVDLEAPLGDANVDEVRTLLSEILPEQESEESLIDLIARYLKF